MSQPRDARTLLQHGSLRDGLAADGEGQGSTGTQFEVPAMDADDDGLPLPAPRQHQPAPERQRPTLLPQGFDAPPKPPMAPRHADPGLVRPGRAIESPRPHAHMESSDVIQVYDAGQSGEVRGSSLHAMAPPRMAAAAPQSARPPMARAAAPAVLSQPAAPRSLPPRPAASPAPAPAPQPLPLDTAQMVARIAAHRGRLNVLDRYARSLEIAAGVVAAVSAVMLLVTLAGLLVSSGPALFAVAAALTAEVLGLGLAVALLALATSLRHQASASAQLSALLEALSMPPSG